MSENSKIKWSNITTAIITATIVSVLLSFGLIGPQREQQLLDTQQKFNQIEKMIIEQSHKLDLYIQTTEVKTADRWTGKNMETFAHELQRDNPTLKVPSVVKIQNR